MAGCRSLAVGQCPLPLPIDPPCPSLLHRLQPCWWWWAALRSCSRTLPGGSCCGEAPRPRGLLPTLRSAPRLPRLAPLGNHARPSPPSHETGRHCFAQGAYRGAGADAIRRRFRIDVGAAAGALPTLPGEGGGEGEGAGGGGGVEEEEDAELAAAIGQLAELALLGAGQASQLYPETLDELYASVADEAPFRIVL